ncbi:hypothetical protein L207DRAFT_517967 [Hyaloscypha variabilis F]|uniref:Uncharacterized protein n=1 Tax=Hyaloscypha variabilis (strain UAMH 11265 / GT02V1 / F) TaxID=1149755 RepID=A0A2J6R5Z4_HYAVF|nr:hypothetical protein L207DRAFT_517967 [Hyaloscypha variabilis F]
MSFFHEAVQVKCFTAFGVDVCLHRFPARQGSDRETKRVHVTCPPFPLSLPQPCAILSNTQRTNTTAAIAPAVRAVALVPTHHTLGSTLYLPLSDPSIVSPIQDICTPSRSLISTPWPQYQDSWEARIQAQSRSGCNPPPRPPPTSCLSNSR